MMKTLTAFATAGAIAVAAVAAPAPAQARNEGAIAAGVVGGLAVGALIGSQYNQPRYGYASAGYYGGPYAYSRCYVTRQKIRTNYGPRWRRVRVCD
jgi:hypothetical protein